MLKRENTHDVGIIMTNTKNPNTLEMLSQHPSHNNRGRKTREFNTQFSETTQ